MRQFILLVAIATWTGCGNTGSSKGNSLGDAAAGDAGSAPGEAHGHMEAMTPSVGTIMTDFVGLAKAMGDPGVTCLYAGASGNFSPFFRLDAASDTGHANLQWFGFFLSEGTSRMEVSQSGGSSMSIDVGITGPQEFRFNNAAGTGNISGCVTTLSTFTATRAALSLDCSGLVEVPGAPMWSLKATFACDYKSLP